MNPTLAKQRCLNHVMREAAARCPACKQYYCRECITEHDDRVICSNCLRKAVPTVKNERRWARPFALTVQAIAGFLAAWMLFLAIGKVLLAIPADFHEGTVWKPFFKI